LKHLSAKLSARTVVLTMAVLLLTAGSVLAAPSPSNKWRLECSGKAQSDGTVVLKVTPKEGEPITASIAIANKTGENDVAKALVKGLKAQLPKDSFHIERDDGEDVLVKKKMGKGDFILEIVSNDVKNVRLHLEKE
jgi:ABC-type molybdate transport system substrate-binding protein